MCHQEYSIKGSPLREQNFKTRNTARVKMISTSTGPDVPNIKKSPSRFRKRRIPVLPPGENFQATGLWECSEKQYPRITGYQELILPTRVCLSFMPQEHHQANAIPEINASSGSLVQYPSCTTKRGGGNPISGGRCRGEGCL